MKIKDKYANAKVGDTIKIIQKGFGNGTGVVTSVHGDNYVELTGHDDRFTNSLISKQYEIIKTADDKSKTIGKQHLLHLIGLAKSKPDISDAKILKEFIENLEL